MRRVVPVLGVAVGVAVLSASPAFAHGASSVIEVHTTTVADGSVNVTADVSYPDHDPVTDAKLVSEATSGTAQTPLDLVPTGRPGQYGAHVRLAPGAWVVTVRSTGTVSDADEAIGRSSSPLTVAAPAAAVRSTTGSSGALAGEVGGGAAVIVLAGGGLAWVARRRRTADESRPSGSGVRASLAGSAPPAS